MRIAFALALLSTLACATVRTPLTSLDEPLAPGGAIEPQLELWLESGAAASPREKESATQEARAALEELVSAHALAPHALEAAAPLLVVRERAIARTASRRTDQTVAKVGLVVGVVVAVVAIAAASSHSKSGGPKLSSGSGGHGAGHLPGAFAGAAAGGHASAPHAGPIGAPISPRSFAPRPRRLHQFDRADIDLDLELGLFDPWREPQAAFIASGDAEPPPPPPDDESPAPPPALELPPLPPLPLDERGFFSGDLTSLSLDLVDRQSGQLLWSGQAEGESDPRDAEALEGLFAEALAGQAWIRAAR